MSDDVACPFGAVTVDLGGAVELSLNGELDIAGARRLWSSVAPILRDRRRGGPPSLILDMTGLEFLDAAGLGMVVRLANEIRGRGGEVLVRPPSRPLVRRVLELSDVGTGQPRRRAVATTHRPCGASPGRHR